MTLLFSDGKYKTLSKRANSSDTGRNGPDFKRSRSIRLKKINPIQ